MAYLKEGTRQLKNNECYEVASKEDIAALNNAFWDLLKQWLDQGLLELEEFQFLKYNHLKIPILYLILKIHKNPQNDKKCKREKRGPVRHKTNKKGLAEPQPYHSSTN